MCLAREGLRVTAFDINKQQVELVNSGRMPFKEEGGEELLSKVLAEKKFTATSDPSMISVSMNIILVMGTPVTSHLYPAYPEFFASVRQYLPFFCDGQLLVLRSTVYPGVTEKVAQMTREHGLDVDVVFCPERISQGEAIRELYELPQIVSALSPSGMKRVRQLFSVFNDDFVELSPMEAEFAKLFTNTWRYIRFAVANQFYMIANSSDLDFYKIYEAITHNYPRIKDMPKAGFAAGPCLFKDTLQLAALTGNTFFLGHSALLVNEGLPDYIVQRLKLRCNLQEKVVGILGMSFKRDSDDHRESLAYKLKNILAKDCREVLTSDPFIRDNDILPVSEVIARSDILILGAPHTVYADLEFGGKEVIDIWDFYGKGALI
ncbi:MAG: nucleotide sugar dehydrogenase [Proteobacteria bacterium]|nr:nucleotide sugar dehydrogenase [Pseudomonadota bacterium]MBU1687331.1 nucleotide sugar dehydrogenase [Pseudomonadota bacterium]